ncbi:DUF192 domain-containing protein [Cypionkella sp.]|jgi:uncharacterized protein|uniref:DUF192 domain-containing protein n=1 Tax=Cypionkella sp. TaxID=2811411 RepID=UPI00275F8725|nr:DUF192 domain-containing protein [Cypionkella sp.]
MGNVRSQIAAIWLMMISAGAGQAACAPDTVELRGPSGVQRFSVEIADTAATRSKGLMLRKHMPSSSGMLFVYPDPTHAVFWMKNTLIPLDMIFADASGLVTHVHSDAIVEDETPIDGGRDVKFVLEINAGLAKRLGISAGAQMRSDQIEKTSAIWSCSVE